MKTLTGERVYLRPLEATDLDRCARWINDQDVNRFLLTGRVPLNGLREQEWFKAVSHSHSDVVYAICLREGDAHIGNCGLHGIDWIDRFGIAGISIGEKDQWGKGLGTEAMRLLCDHSFRILNLRRVELSVYDFNERAVRSYRSLGFREEGVLKGRRFKNGVYVDEILMVITADEWAARTRAAVMR